MSETAIVFVHGWSANSGVWGSQIEFFKNEYRTISINLPGHAGPPMAPGVSVPLRLNLPPDGRLPNAGEKCGVELARLLEREKINSAHLVGWSLGSQVICHCALAAPERIKSLTMVGGTPCFVAPDGLEWGVHATKAKMFKKMMRDDFKKGFATFIKSFFDHEKNLSDAEFDRIRGILLDHPPEQKWAAALLDDFTGADIRPLLDSLSVPIFVIHGAHDRISPPGAVELWRTAPGFGGSVILPECGHAPFLTAPEIFNDTLKRFLAKL
jgi:pimeloyl-[acyl-carrier protein] methyl ester esterase